MYLLYPETAKRSLESIETMFSAASPLYKQMERAYDAEMTNPGSFEQQCSEEKGSLHIEGRK